MFLDDGKANPGDSEGQIALTSFEHLDLGVSEPRVYLVLLLV